MYWCERRKEWRQRFVWVMFRGYAKHQRKQWRFYMVQLRRQERRENAELSDSDSSSAPAAIPPDVHRGKEGYTSDDSDWSRYSLEYHDALDFSI